METKYKMNWIQDGREMQTTFWATCNIHAKNVAEKIHQRNQAKATQPIKGYGFCQTLPRETR